MGFGGGYRVLNLSQLVDLATIKVNAQGLIYVDTGNIVDGTTLKQNATTNHIYTSTQTDSFTNLTTDINGLITITLSDTPSATSNLNAYCTAPAGCIVEISSLSGNQLTVLIRKGFTLTSTAVSGALTSLPTGVSEGTSSNQNTGTPSATSNALSGGGSVGSGAHTHTFNYIYSHGHTLSNTNNTPLNILASTSGVNLTVSYSR
jgi:hypothetical protein